jgi:hypothetical protein
MRQTSNAIRVRSPLEIYNDLPNKEGRIVEMQGEVAGTVAREGKRTILLRMNENMAVLEVGPALTDISGLRTGSMVSLLAQVTRKAAGNDVVLTIVATSTQVENNRPAAAAPASDNSVIIVPPMTSVALPQAPSQPLVAPSVSRPAPAPRTTPVQSYGGLGLGLESGGSLESQKPGYKALVRRHNRKLTVAQVDEIATALLTAAYENKMDPRFLAAIISVESDFDIYCLSSSGAMGLGQLMPFNLKEARIRDPWNPTQNVIGTARLLRGHLNDYAGRTDGTLLAVAAYNAGPGAVRRAGYRVPSGQQVQRYVWKVYYRYKEFAPDKF